MTPPATPPDPGLFVSLAIQLGPWLRTDSTPYTGDLETFTDQLTSYFRDNLDRFTAIRDTDLFLAVSSRRGTETAGRQYRTGHYVKNTGHYVKNQAVKKQADPASPEAETKPETEQAETPTKNAPITDTSDTSDTTDTAPAADSAGPKNASSATRHTETPA